MELKARRYSLKGSKGEYVSNLAFMLPDADGAWCYYEEAQELSMAVAGKQSEFLVIEKQILRDIALNIHNALSEIAKHPSCMHLIPCRESIGKLAEQVHALESIAK